MTTDTFSMTEKLNSMLNRNIVHFTYTKKNGETRHARGTKSSKIITEKYGEDKLPSGNGAPKEGVIAYFDLDKEAWRSFQVGSLVSIDNDDLDEGNLNLI